MPLISPYIREEWKENILNFKYKGSDSSIFYVYFTNPVCNFLVEYMPMNLSANLLGLFCNLLIFTITFYYSGFNGSIPIPSWACHTCSFLYFSYMILDNMDGKQARRTKTSSPLGMMFDHGCDALVTFVFTNGLGTITGLNSVGWFAIIWTMTSIPFFLNTWEEYYTGELNLPWVNGVSEGTVIACLFMNFVGFFGLDLFFSKITIMNYQIQYNHLIVIICFISGVGFGLNSLINVIRNFKEKRNDVFENLFIFISLLLTLCIVIVFSEADSEIMKNYPKVLIILYGFAFTKLVGHLQLAHICDSKFMQYRKSLLTTFFCLATVSLMNYTLGTKIVNIDYLIVVFLIMHVVVWIHFAYYLTEEFCVILGIYRFSTQKRIEKGKDNKRNN